MGKRRRTGVPYADFGEFWRTEEDGFTAIGKSTTVYVTLVCVDHVTVQKCEKITHHVFQLLFI